MLNGLSIRDIVLIERLDLAFQPGLSVLTGETGAGKSILLDSLALGLGGRGDAGLVRQAAEKGSVALEFDVPANHPARRILADQGLDDDGPLLIIRRQITSGGRSRAFINDQPVSVGLLRQVGESLIEIHGQHTEQGLLNAANHGLILDSFGGLDEVREKLAEDFARWQSAAAAVTATEQELAALEAEEAWLRHTTRELADLDPRPGEEEKLAAERQVGLHGGKVLAAVAAARALFEGEDGTEASSRLALRQLERIGGLAGELAAPAIAALERAAIEVAEAAAELAALEQRLEVDPRQLEKTEERLFALRDLARKHRCRVDDLPAVQARLEARLTALDAGESQLAGLCRAAAEARGVFEAGAAALSRRRTAAAVALDKAVTAELAPVRMEKARFITRLLPLERENWGAAGGERIAFEVSTNPGAAPGPLSRIASGGELSRFMLALKVILSRRGSTTTVIFDEIDRGVSGAVADAVGERLARLAGESQVLVVTHSPQVAARADHHFRVEKTESPGGGTTSAVKPLDAGAVREEIARMLAGATVTEAARVAAASLIGQQS